MYCQHCGKEIEDNARFCQYCGQEVGQTPKKEVVQQTIIIKKEREPKSQFIAIILCLFLGMIGIHDFYLERNAAGVAKLLIMLLLGWIVIGIIINSIWCLIDFVLILCKGFEALMPNEELEEETKKVQEYLNK